ncbi:glycoside hydrolase family 16 protein [Actinoplanes sp. CA-131856]
MRSLIAAAVALALVAPVPASAAPPDPAGWSVASASGSVTLRRVTALKGGPATTAVEVRSEGGFGSWAYALSSVQGLTFEVGRTYRMTAYLRDPGGAGRRYGMLLANGSWQHRPAKVAEYVSPANAGWQRITRTFLATAPGAADTGLYFALPASGAFTVQIANASVQAVTAYTPRSVRSAPTRTIGFSGAEGTAPDAAVWNRQTGAGGWGNGERQTYTSSTANARVDGAGNLKITALRTDGGGYTSARLNTQGKVTIAPGSYVEASITAPTGDAVWPAFWLLGANMPSAGWPACGELDIFEGTGSEPTLAKSAVHLAGRSYDWSEGTTDLGVPLDAGDAEPTFSSRTMTVGPISVWRGGVPA